MATEATTAGLGSPAPDFLLPGACGQFWSRGDAAGPSGLVVMFICNHCPYVQAILDRIRDREGLGVGETTADGRVSLLMARCLGSCGLAPAGVFDGEVAGRLDPQQVLDRIGRWRHDDPA
jgi:hypothetical protein